MDRIENQNQKTLSQFITSAKFLKRVTKLLVSVSVFSLLVSHSTWLSFLHSFNFHFSTFPVRLFSHTLDKNCIFLLCNGLLMFLAKYSGLFSSSSSKHDLSNEYFKHYEDQSRPEMITMETEVPLMEKEESELETIDDQTQQNAEEIIKRETEQVEQEEPEAESRFLVTCEGGEEETKAAIEENDEMIEDPQIGTFMEEEEEEREEGNGMLSTEELNKKFDEFIRKMKEELRIEARQQLVMV